MVMFIYRPEYYKNEAENPDLPQGYTVIDIAKHRNGKLGEVNLRFVGQYARFEEFGQDRLASADEITLGPNPNFNTMIIGSKMNDDAFGPMPSITSDDNLPF